MLKNFDYSGHIYDNTRNFAISVKKCFWPLIFGEQFFLPRLKVTIHNQGKDINEGFVKFYITELDKIEQISKILIYQGDFQDVYTKDINKLKAGKKLKFVFTISERFLKPERYVLRMTIHEWINQSPAYPELFNNLINGKITLEQLKQTIDSQNQKQSFLKDHQLVDFRFMEVLKIHSLHTVLTALGALIGTTIGTSIITIIGIIKLINGK